MLNLISTLLAASALLAPSMGVPLSGSQDVPSSTLTDWERIYQVINLYPLAVDFNSTHELFPQIFAPHAFANYTSDNGDRQNLHGLKQITDTFASDGEHYDAQHLLGSIRINIDDKSLDKANTTSEAITTAFGRGRYVGQQATFYGIYRDSFERLPKLGWRITTRYYQQQGPAAGNVTLLKGP